MNYIYLNERAYAGVNSQGNYPENTVMKDVMEILRAKEQELLKVKRQVEALKVAAPLLGDEEENSHGRTNIHAASKGSDRLG